MDRTIPTPASSKRPVEFLGPVGVSEAVQTFLGEKRLPDLVLPAFVQAIQRALSGAGKIVLAGTRLALDVTGDGVPCVMVEFKELFDCFMADVTKDTTNIDFVVER